MARHKRRAVTGNPITSHELFPAVAALWFAALFGLGSLAVRPALLEQLAITSRIDLLIPAAAPPLGYTARLLLALGLAALGAALGTILARRLAGSGRDLTGQDHSDRTEEDDRVPARRRDAHPDAPPRRPISATEELDLAELEPAAPRPGAGRRSALTFEHEAAAFVPEEAAPLPGGRPQFLATVLASTESSGPDPQAPEPAIAPEPASEDNGLAAAALPDPAMLGLDDLTARLAQAMRRRSEARDSLRLAKAPPAAVSPGPLDLDRYEDDPVIASFAANAASGEDEADEPDEAIPETSYGSLLGLGPAAPRGPSLRAEAPEIGSGTVEPVVIFPGQAPRGTPPADVPEGSLPGIAASGQPLASGNAAPSIAPDEAERALREALANLQRMSGAA